MFFYHYSKNLPKKDDFIRKEFGTKLVPNSFILVLDTNGAVVEWALTIWESETVRGTVSARA